MPLYIRTPFPEILDPPLTPGIAKMHVYEGYVLPDIWILIRLRLKSDKMTFMHKRIKLLVFLQTGDL